MCEYGLYIGEQWYRHSPGLTMLEKRKRSERDRGTHVNT